MSLPLTSPTEAGIDPEACRAFIEAVEAERLGLHALAIARHGRIGATAAWAPYRLDVPHMMFSVSKSLTATAVGIAQDEGLLDIDEPVLDLFPDHATAAARANAADLRLRHLLAMATGHQVDTMPLMRGLPSHDWVRIFLESPIVDPPGTRFGYNSGASLVLSAAVRSRSGQSLTDYLTPRLFEPLGIATPTWERAPSGLDLGWSGLRLTVADMAAFGQLYLDEGLWQGRRLLSRQWVESARRRHVDTHLRAADWHQGYGLHLWRSRHGYRADGSFGQFILILPEHDAVVAITSGTDRFAEVLDEVWDKLLPGLTGEPTAPDGAAYEPRAAGAPRRHRERRLADDLVRPGSLGDLIAPGCHRLPPLRLGASYVACEPDGTLVLGNRDGEEERHPVAPSPGWGPETTSALWPYEELTRVRMRSRGGYLADGRFRIVQQCIETPFARTWTFSNEGDVVRCEVGLDHGFWTPYTESFDLPARVATKET